MSHFHSELAFLWQLFQAALLFDRQFQGFYFINRQTKSHWRPTMRRCSLLNLNKHWDTTTDWSTSIQSSGQGENLRFPVFSFAISPFVVNLFVSLPLSDPLMISQSPKPITIYIQHQQLKLSRRASKEALFLFSISTLYLRTISPLLYALSSSICSSSYSAIRYSQPSVSHSISQAVSPKILSFCAYLSSPRDFIY